MLLKLPWICNCEVITVMVFLITDSLRLVDSAKKSI